MRNQKFKKSMMATAFLATFGATSVQAEEDLFFTEMPIVASVSRLPQKLSEAPASVTVIDREMIRASGFRTVEDLMRLVPGFQVTSHNQDAALVAYHGLTGGMTNQEYTPRVQVLVDGRSQYSPLFKSGIHWNLIPVVLENIDRIEVTRGSNTVAYGSNAALGVINIITQDPSQTKGWMVAANRGINFVRDDTVRWGGKVGEADVRFTVHQLGDNGFQWGLYNNQWVDTPDDRRSRVIDLKTTLPLNVQDEIEFSFSEAKDQSLFGRPLNNVASPLWYSNTSSTHLGVQWKRSVAADEEIKVRYGLTRDQSLGAYASTNSNYFDSAGTSVVHEIEFDSSFPLSDKSRMLWGGAGKWSALSSIAQFNETAWKNRSSYRLFGNYELRPSSDWLLNAGASLERDSLSGVHFDPRVSASYHIHPEHTVRFVASLAHRTPSLYEDQGRSQKYANAALQNDITYLGQGVEAEKIKTIELGYFAELKSVRASADVRVFREHIPNLIQIVPLALSASMADQVDSSNDSVINNIAYPNGRADGALNMENVQITGYEYQLRWQPFEHTRLLYNNALVTIKTNPDVSKIAENNTTDGTLATFGSEGDSNNTWQIIRQSRQSAPSRAQSAMLIQKLPYDMTASVMYFRASPMRWRRKSPGLFEASERFDWRLAKLFKFGSTRAELAYTVQMANESQQGRQSPQRLAEKLHWLSLRLNY